MGNIPWLSKWQRSPRQDRRVVEDGRFVELGKIHDETVIEEQAEVNTALEVVHEPVNAEAASTSGNVPLDAPNGPSAGGLESSGESNDANSRETVGTTEEVSNPSVSTSEGPSISETSQAELEPIDAVAEHEKGSQTIAEIAAAMLPEEPAEFTPLADEILAEHVTEARLAGDRTDEDLPF